MVINTCPSSSSFFMNRDDDEIKVVGSVGKNTGWLCYSENLIVSVNSARLHEVILYKSLMQSFPVPCPLLVNAQPFNSR